MNTDLITRGDLNFEFAFNSKKFSDRVLHIIIVAEPQESRSNGQCFRSQQQQEIKSGKGDEPSRSIESSWSTNCSSVLRVESIDIASVILAAKSPFFYKLFSNGMQESEQRHTTLRITDSEEAAVMELLRFMHSGKLSTNSPRFVLDVLMAADKFEVESCIRYCSQLLRSTSMTTESALQYLELPSNTAMASAVQPLINLAKEFLRDKYRDISKLQKEAVNLPLAGIEAILSSDNLEVIPEDVVFDFVIEWARAHYPKIDERRELLESRLFCLVRFPHMACRMLNRCHIK